MGEYGITKSCCIKLGSVYAVREGHRLFLCALAKKCSLVRIHAPLLRSDQVACDNNNNDSIQAFQLIVLARYLLGVPKP